MNAAGKVTQPLTYGPFTVTDPTPPTNPSFCAGFGGTPGVLTVQLTTPSGDPETGVSGYQYQVRPVGGAVRWVAPDSPLWRPRSAPSPPRPPPTGRGREEPAPC